MTEAGADLILFTPLFDEPEHMERLAAERGWHLRRQAWPLSGSGLSSVPTFDQARLTMLWRGTAYGPDGRREEPGWRS